MHQRGKSAGRALPLPSLRLLVSPLRLTYSFAWQVVLQRNVAQYGRVEEFVTLVMETVPDLLSFKQCAQLILGLRARMILEMLNKDQPPNAQAIQHLLDKMDICASMGKTDAQVEKSQANFVALVQALLKSTNERTHFFQEVFPAQYGAKYNTALQALIGGLVYRLEQLLPMPDVSQIGSMISAAPSVLEECGLPVSDLDPLKVLLQHQRQTRKGSFSTAISSTVGDCVLTSLSFCVAPVEPPEQPEANVPSQSHETTLNGTSPAPCSAFEETADVSEDSVHTVTEQREDDAGDGTTSQMVSEENAAMSVASASEDVVILQDDGFDSGAAPERQGGESLTTEIQQPLVLVPLDSANSFPTSPIVHGACAAERDLQVDPQVRLASLQRWVSQVASNTISLPALPPLPQKHAREREVGSGETSRPGSSVETEGPQSDGASIQRAIIRKRPPKNPHGQASRKKTPKATHTCSECQKGFPYQSMLEDHLRIHTGEKPFKCSECGRAFRTVGFLTNHQKIHSSFRPFKCEECSRCFLKRADLQKHQRVHRGDKPYKCTVCGKGFTQASYHKIHMDCHTSVRSFPCTHCEKSFPTSFKLSIHLRWHTVERLYICEQCGRRFHCPSLLKRHMGYHVGDRQFLCAQCGRTFVYMFDLKKHQRDHGPKPQLPCPVCRKVFTSNGCLKVHMRTHTTDKPYRCPVCDKAFSQIGNLSVHKRMHSNERPYGCDQCGKTYKLSTHLREHKRTHSGEKPCRCATCGKGFRYPGILRKHEQSHSREPAEQAEPPRRCAHTGRRRRHSSKRTLDGS